MRSIEYSAVSLTEEEADVIADAYFRSSKDPFKMAKILGIGRFDLNLIMHPLVQKYIEIKQEEIKGSYSLKEHLEYLKKIRDQAFDEENLKIALSAEISLGKAAGLYEPKKPEDPTANAADPKALTTEELRRQLALESQDNSLPPPNWQELDK